ncbi:hypothetical protein GCM10009646_87430 [Streptomyces aureus]
MALDRHHHPGNRSPPSPAEPWLTSYFDRPNNRTTPGEWKPAPTRRDNRALTLPHHQKTVTPHKQSPRQRTDEDS